MNDEFWITLKRIVEKSEIIIDRPKGSKHPRFPEIVYEIDYGYLKNTKSMDDEGIDVWLGSQNNKFINGIIITVDEIKNDSEIKILIGCTDEEVNKIIVFHNTKFMKGIYIKNETRNN